MFTDIFSKLFGKKGKKKDNKIKDKKLEKNT